MNLWILGFENFGVGFIIGLIYSWNRKVMIGIWVGAIILFCILNRIAPLSPSDYVLKHFVIQFFTVSLGFFAGCWHWDKMKEKERKI